MFSFDDFENFKDQREREKEREYLSNNEFKYIKAKQNINLVE